MMKNLDNFKIFNENSKNDPIAEIYYKEKVGIILLGIPGSGKSTFAKDSILTKNRNFKTFSTDTVSKLFTKDTSVYHTSSSELSFRSLYSYIDTGNNFIYDVTGANDVNITNICNKANDNNYKILFILKLIPINTAKIRNMDRGKSGGHLVDNDYIDMVYSKQLQTTKQYLKIKHDAFYIVMNDISGNKYKYYKFNDGKLTKRKVNKYLPFIKESVDLKKEVDDIIECTLDFVEDYNMSYISLNDGPITYRDYVNKNYSNFKPVKNVSNILKSSFCIIYKMIDGYEELSNLIGDMTSCIGRLNDLGWNFYNIEVNTQSLEGINKFSAKFKFDKPDVSVGKFKLPTKDELDSYMRNNMSIAVVYTDKHSNNKGDYISIDIDSVSYDGGYPDDIYEKLEDMRDYFGFGDFDYSLGRSVITFEYDDSK